MSRPVHRFAKDLIVFANIKNLDDIFITWQLTIESSETLLVGLSAENFLLVVVARDICGSVFMYDTNSNFASEEDVGICWKFELWIEIIIG